MMDFAYYGTTAFYAALSAGVVYVSRKTESYPIACALAGSCLMSNMIAFSLPFAWRLLLFPVIDVAVALTAMFMALFLGHARLPLIAIMALAIASCTANVAASLHWPLTWTDRHFHEVVENLSFTAQCLVVFSWRYWSADRRPRHLWLLPTAHRTGVERSGSVAQSRRDISRERKG
jgi:hypothetical protein